MPQSDDQIWKVPSQGGKPVPLTRHGGFEGFESMDGKYLYYSKSQEHSGIWRMDLSNGNEAPVPELSGPEDYRQWALGGTGIFFVPYDEAFSKDAAVRFFDFATRSIVRVGRWADSLPPAPARLRCRAMKHGCCMFTWTATTAISCWSRILNSKCGASWPSPLTCDPRRIDTSSIVPRSQEP